MGLDLVEVLMAVETEFGIAVPEQELGVSGVVTVKDFSDLIIRLAREQHGVQLDPEPTLRKVIGLIEAYSSRWCKQTTTLDSRLRDVLSM